MIISTKTKDIASVTKDGNKIIIRAVSEHYADWLRGLYKSPLIKNDKIIQSIEEITRTRIYKPFKWRRGVLKNFKYKRVVNYVI